MAVDNIPLQESAWSRLQAVRKRLTKATSDLHRHESKDEPEYILWMYATCPAVISEIRDLQMQIQSLVSMIARVEHYAFYAGRSPQSVWHDYKGEPPLVEEEDDDDDFSIELEKRIDEEIEAMIDEFMDEPGTETRGSAKEGVHPEHEPIFGSHKPRRRAPESLEMQSAREIYRRLVQQLHPDRGGAWTPERQALWHEVQQAWDARDADWLARLEAEYEITADTLTVQSAVGRLYAAIREIESARRDTERKLRQYRKTPAWRFSLKPRTPEDAAELAVQLQSDLEHVREHLGYLQQIPATWSRPMGQAHAKRHARRSHSAQQRVMEFW